MNDNGSSFNRMELTMTKYLLMLIVAVSFLLPGCSVNTEKCLGKEGFKNCEDFKAAAKKAVGNDEAYRFHSIAKKCHCEE
jgi:predicted small secreted protein